MPVRRSLVNAVIAASILALATVAVGLSANSDGLFSIVVRPVFLQLGVDIDIRFGSMHLHANWSALPQESPRPSTNCEPE